MKLFRQVVLAAAVGTYILIFIGGLVRVSGAGLGCPDWPRCYGRFIPPFTNADLQQAMASMPAPMVASITPDGPELDPSKFNVTLAWIEYLNRLAGVLVGGLMLAAALLALRREVRAHRGIVAAVWGSLAVVAFTGWLGKVVVQSQLHPLMVSIHLGGALVVASLLLYAAWAAHAPTMDTPATAPGPREDDAMDSTPGGPPARLAPPWWLLGLWALTLAQITLGADLRGSLDLLEQQNVGLASVDLIRIAGGAKHFHMLLGLLLAGGGVAAVRTLGSRPWRAARTPVLLHLARVQMLLILVQVGMGFAFGIMGLFPLLRLFHLWVASLAAGGWLLLFLLARRAARAPAPAGVPRGLVLWTSGGAATAALLMMVAVVTLQQARAARNVMPIFGTVPAFSYPAWPGGTVDRQRFEGRITVVNFMFTRCGSICPTMNQHLMSLRSAFASSPQVQFVSFTVDPSYDTLAVLETCGKGLGAGDDRWQFVCAPSAEIPAFAHNAFLVSGDCPRHSSQFILVDPQGRIRGYFDGTHTDAVRQLKEQIQRLQAPEGD